MDKHTDYMLTTIDNPYDPFNDFDHWYQFDMLKGYNCCGLVDRVARYEESMSSAERDEEYKRAVSSIIANDFMNLYCKYYDKDVKNRVST